MGLWWNRRIKNMLKHYFRKNRHIAERFHRIVLPGLDYEVIGSICLLNPRKILGPTFVLPDDWNSTYLLHFPAHDTVIFKQVKLNNVWDANGISRTLKAMKPEKTYDLIDVGANVGLFSIQLMDCLRASGRAGAICDIVALEPVPLIKRIAQSNFAAAGLDPSALQDRALGRQRQDLQIFLDAGNGGNNSLLPDQVPNQLSKSITVTVDTLDGVLSERGISITNEIVLKIDVQGFEADVILGISEALWQNVSVLVLEITPSSMARLTSEDLEAFFQRIEHFDVHEVFQDSAEDGGESVTVVSPAELRKMATDPQKEYFNLVARAK